MPSWEVAWGFAAKHALLNMPWRDATQVDATVLRFAASGQGDAERIADEPRGVWLRSSGYLMRLRLDPEARTLLVLYVIHTRS
jgi:hypothetical protein